MTATRSIPSWSVSETDRGTSEADWLRSSELASAPLLDVARLDGPVVILAPHPDDEVLALGGMIFELARAHTRLRIVAVTDGEASHPRSVSVSPAAIAARRAVERSRALASLGAAEVDVVRLRVPDSRVADAPDLRARIAREIEGAAIVVAPWEHDGHADHDAVGRASRAAAADVDARVLAYPVWAWHWASPRGAELPERIVRSPLSREARAAKAEAIGAYRSQIRPIGDGPGDAAILPPHVLARFLRPFETLFLP